MLDVYSVKKRIWKVDIGKIIIAVNYFRKMLHCWCLTGFWICLRFCTWQGSEYIRALNIPGLGICQGSNMPRFWICQGSEYARVLNMLGFRIYQGPESARVQIAPALWMFQGSEYASGLGYARILSMPLVLNILGFWKWQDSDYTSILNKPLVLNIPGF